MHNFYSRLNKKFRGYIALLRSIKEKTGIRFVDAHVHPLDVMGVIHHSDYLDSDFLLKQSGNPPDSKERYLKASLIEKLKFGYLVNLLGEHYCRFFPNLLFNEIKSKYRTVNKNRLIDEMSISFIDNAVLIPIEPWSLTSDVFHNFNDRRFYHLGSIDFHGVKIEMIDSRLKSYVNEYNIKGIKLHPNLQDFHPIPSMNNDDVSRKLRIIYSFCEKYHLYILFHGGTSFFTKKINKKFSYSLRSKTNALLENFFYNDFQNSIFSEYNIPFIIAHLGHYGLNSVNRSILRQIATNYKNVYFDTTGTSPKLISEVLNLIGENRLIFGSDAIYNNQLLSLLYVCEGIEMVYSGSDFERVLIKIFSENYQKIVHL